MKASKRLRIRGKVQGVFFRESMKQEARRLGLTGWVRNRSDGSVEALIQGEVSLLEEMMRWAQIGPPSARVDSVETEDHQGDTIFTDFTREQSE